MAQGVECLPTKHEFKAQYLQKKKKNKQPFLKIKYLDISNFIPIFDLVLLLKWKNKWPKNSTHMQSY
jgi:hypothetical protein